LKKRGEKGKRKRKSLIKGKEKKGGRTMRSYGFGGDMRQAVIEVIIAQEGGK